MGCCLRSLKLEYIIIIIITGIGILIISKLMKNLRELEEENKKLRSEIKSKEVKFGKSFEHFVPFIKNFPGIKKKQFF